MTGALLAVTRWARRPLRGAAGGLIVAVLAAGCGGLGIGVGPGNPPPLPDRPTDSQAVQPFLLVAQGIGPAGTPYRSWIYRSKDGFYCFEVAHGSGAGSTCSPDRAGILGLGVMMGDATQGTMVTGGTANPAVTQAVVVLDDATRQPVALVRPGAFLEDARVFVISVPAGRRADRIELLNGAGDVVETLQGS